MSIIEKTVNLTCPDPSHTWYKGKGKSMNHYKDQFHPLSLHGTKELEGHFACAGSAVYLKVRGQCQEHGVARSLGGQDFCACRWGKTAGSCGLDPQSRPSLAM